MHNTRNSSNLIPPFERLRITQQSIFFQASKAWNALPDSIKQLSHLSLLKETKHLSHSIHIMVISDIYRM